MMPMVRHNAVAGGGLEPKHRRTSYGRARPHNTPCERYSGPILATPSKRSHKRADDKLSVRAWCHVSAICQWLAGQKLMCMLHPSQKAPTLVHMTVMVMEHDLNCACEQAALQ